MDDTDGMGEALDGQLRVALTIATQFGERISRLREQWARLRESELTKEARHLEQRFEGERGAARASLAVVREDGWWEQATPKAISSAHETATVWRDYDDVALEASAIIRDQVQQRYGIDVAAPGADSVAVAIALREEEALRAHATSERRQAGEELTAAQAYMAIADKHEEDRTRWAAVDREVWVAPEKDASLGTPIELGDFATAERPGDYEAFLRWEETERELTDESKRGAAGDTKTAGSTAREQSSLEYDSAERRRGFAKSLDGKADEKAINARVLADVDQGTHPREAVTTKTRTAKARKSNTGTSLTRERGGLSR